MEWALSTKVKKVPIFVRISMEFACLHLLIMYKWAVSLSSIYKRREAFEQCC